MANGKELREMLARTREQKFRKKTEAQINGIVKNAAMWQDPDWVKKQLEIIRDPNRNLRISESRKKYWNSENKKTLAKTSKKRWDDPEFYEKIIGPQRHPVMTPYGQLDSAAELYHKHNKMFIDKNKIMPHIYYKLSDGPGEPTYEMVCVTPHGEFKNANWAFIKANELNDLYVTSRKTKDGKFAGYKNWWHAVTTKFPDQFYEVKMIRREWDM